MLDAVNVILAEIKSVLDKVDEEQMDALLAVIGRSKRVVTAGAGRVGLATRGFAMRLGHLGYSAYALGDMTVPGLSAGDLLIVASGSGETPTIAHVAEQAKKAGAAVALITANPESRIGKIADNVLVIPAPNKASSGSVHTIQPMTTLNEQCLQVFFDAVVLKLMSNTGATEQDMWSRHSTLE